MSMMQIKMIVLLLLSSKSAIVSKFHVGEMIFMRAGMHFKVILIFIITQLHLLESPTTFNTVYHNFLGVIRQGAKTLVPSPKIKWLIKVLIIFQPILYLSKTVARSSMYTLNIIGDIIPS